MIAITASPSTMALKASVPRLIASARSSYERSRGRTRDITGPGPSGHREVQGHVPEHLGELHARPAAGDPRAGRLHPARCDRQGGPRRVAEPHVDPPGVDPREEAVPDSSPGPAQRGT